VYCGERVSGQSFMVNVVVLDFPSKLLLKLDPDQIRKALLLSAQSKVCHQLALT